MEGSGCWLTCGTARDGRAAPYITVNFPRPVWKEKQLEHASPAVQHSPCHRDYNVVKPHHVYYTQSLSLCLSPIILKKYLCMAVDELL